MPRMRGFGLVALTMVAVALGGWTCGRPSRPNVLLITIDTLRADHLSCYGYDRIATPNIDRLAADGVLFEHAFADVTWTTASMASVMTGLYAPKHGVQTSYQRLPAAATTLAEYLQRAGFDTGAIIGSFPLDSIFGLDQGFRTYDDTFSAPLWVDPKKPSPHAKSVLEPVPSEFSENRDEMAAFLRNKAAHDAYRPDPQVTDAAVQWLHGAHHEPFFLWVHYFGPHEKPQPAADVFEQIRRQLAEYDPDVEIADREVGRLLDAFRSEGALSHTMVVLHADHGQSLNEHGYFGHGRYLFDPSQRVPLIIRLPDTSVRGARVPDMVRNLDIMPTVLSVVNVAPDAALDGRSLLPALTGGRLPVAQSTYAETYLSANRLFADVVDPSNDVRVGMRRLGVRTPRWKYVVNDPVPFADTENSPPVTNELRRRQYSEALYDLSADPGELNDVAPLHRELASAFLRRIWEEQKQAAPTAASKAIDEETRQRLKSLGYVD